MLTKVVILFLLAMAGLALFGKMFRSKPPRLPRSRLAAPPRCARCGEFIVGRAGCTCGDPPRIEGDR